MLTYYLLNARERVEDEQESWMRLFQPLLIGVVVTKFSAAAQYETRLAHAVERRFDPSRESCKG